MHELSHALSIGWNDDKDAAGFEAVGECYSGQDCVGPFDVGPFRFVGGNDQTPENVVLPSDTTSSQVWSIMARTNEPAPLNGNRFAFSIEELSTVDFEDIPATDE